MSIPFLSLNVKDLAKDRKSTISKLRHCYSLLNSLLFQTGQLYQKLVVFVSLKTMNVLSTDIFTSFFASTLKKDKNFVSNVIIYNNESIDNRIEILVLFFCVLWLSIGFHVSVISVQRYAWLNGRVFFCKVTKIGIYHLLIFNYF